MERRVGMIDVLDHVPKEMDTPFHRRARTRTCTFQVRPNTLQSSLAPAGLVSYAWSPNCALKASMIRSVAWRSLSVTG